MQSVLKKLFILCGKAVAILNHPDAEKSKGQCMNISSYFYVNIVLQLK